MTNTTRRSKTKTVPLNLQSSRRSDPRGGAFTTRWNCKIAYKRVATAHAAIMTEHGAKFRASVTQATGGKSSSYGYSELMLSFTWVAFPCLRRPLRPVAYAEFLKKIIINK